MTNIHPIMRIDNPMEWGDYIKKVIRQNWNLCVMEFKIKISYYRRLLSKQQAHAHSDLEKYNSGDFIKGPCIAEFLNVPEDFTGKRIYFRKSID